VLAAAAAAGTRQPAGQQQQPAPASPCSTPPCSSSWRSPSRPWPGRWSWRWQSAGLRRRVGPAVTASWPARRLVTNDWSEGSPLAAAAVIQCFAPAPPGHQGGERLDVSRRWPCGGSAVWGQGRVCARFRGNARG